MRLRRLDLTRFGHFDGAALDFGPPRACDVTVVYGDNEAGKSTAFAAWLDLLFGIPLRTPHAYRHTRADLEVGAVLDLPTGEQTVRRTSKGLLDAEGHPLEELRLADLRGGLDRDAFASRFSLDEASLRAGGQAIATGQGDLGEALHVGASGRAGLGAALSALEARVTTFHVKGGRKTTLAQAKRDLADLKDRIGQASLAPTGWDRLQSAVAEAEGRAEDARRNVAAARAQVALAKRAADLRAVEAHITEIDAALATAPNGPDLPPDAATRHADLSARLDTARTTLAAHDNQIEAQLRALAAAGMSDPPLLPLPLLSRAKPLLEAAVTAQRAAKEAETRVVDLSATLPDAGEDTDDPAPLEAALADLPDPDRLSDLTEQAARARHAARDAAIGLPPDWPAKVAAGLPEAQDVARAVASLTQAEERLARAETDLTDARATLAARTRAEAAALAMPDQVSEADRRAARLARDAAWDRHRTTLDAASADAFAAAMREDDLVQQGFAAGTTARLRLAQAREALSEAQADLETAENEFKNAQQDREKAKKSLQNFTSRLGADPNTPPEALAPRLDRLRNAAQTALEAEQAETALATLQTRITAAEARLTDLLGPVGDLRKAARDRLRQLAEARGKADARAEAQRQLDDALKDAEAKTRAATRAEADLRDALTSTPLATVPLVLLERCLPDLTALAEAHAAQAEAIQTAETAKDGLDRLFAGQSDTDIARLTQRDAQRRKRADLEDRRATLSLPDTDALTTERAHADDPDRLTQLEAVLDDAEAALAQAQTDLGAARQARDSAWHGAGADDLRQERAVLLARLGQQARTAAAAQLARALGRRALAVYDRENRSALLSATQTAFARLTGGAWPGLATDSDGKGGQQLFAVGPQGRTRIDQLSAGTQGQVYLALRLAGYDLFTQAQGARPFILDDVAETFDDSRARETMILLGELGQRGQAIFLTHHRHLAQMAQDTLDGVRVIEMPPRDWP